MQSISLKYLDILTPIVSQDEPIFPGITLWEVWKPHPDDNKTVRHLWLTLIFILRHFFI